MHSLHRSNWTDCRLPEGNAWAEPVGKLRGHCDRKHPTGDGRGTGVQTTLFWQGRCWGWSLIITSTTQSSNKIRFDILSFLYEFIQHILYICTYVVCRHWTYLFDIHARIERVCLYSAKFKCFCTYSCKGNARRGNWTCLSYTKFLSLWQQLDQSSCSTVIEKILAIWHWINFRIVSATLLQCNI